MKRILSIFFVLVLIGSFLYFEGFNIVSNFFYADSLQESETKDASLENRSMESTAAEDKDIKNIEGYSGEPFVEVNGNIPYFSESELTEEAYEEYGSLDALGRCGVCTACIGKELMPTGERESISSIKPTGWCNVRYKGVVEGGYLYNRCHLIGYQLTGENRNRENLITGTRYMNVEGMLPFENMVAEYIEKSGNHVLYRVTPVFEGDNLLAYGVRIEAQSVEDGGDGIRFNVFCYNVQPGIKINYKDGSSKMKKK